jgi:hypothetical protein
MSVELTPLLNRFVTHMNQQETAAFSACFAEDAVVEDEGKTHRGLDAIQGWISNAFTHYAPILEPKQVTETETGSILSGHVSGNFPGSPVMLNYHLTHDGAVISALRCVV